MSKLNTIEITRTMVVTDEDIDDIVDMALMGGIMHWSDSVKADGELLGDYVSEQISRGGEIWIHDCKDQSAYKLTKQKLLNGIKLAAEDGYDDLLEGDGRNLKICLLLLDEELADVIVQYALFGEVVYG